MELPSIDGMEPPSDIETEAAVLAAMLLERGAIDDVLDVLGAGEDDFFSEPHRLIARAVFAMHEAGEAVDVVTVAHWLRNRQLMQRVDVAYLGRVIDHSPGLGDLRAHAGIVARLASVRRVIRVCQVAAAEGYHQRDFAAWLERTEAAVYDATRGRDAKASVMMAEVMRETFAHLDRLHETDDRAVLRSTGLVNVDDITAGLVDGDLMVIGGRPGMGKTSMLYEFVLAVAGAGEHVALSTLEMPKLQVGGRLLAMRSGADLGRMRRGHMTPIDWNGAHAAGDFLSSLPIHVDDRASVTVLEVRAFARRSAFAAERKGKRLGLVGVDYLQLMNGSGRSREEEISKISRGLKQLAKDLNVPVVALSQLNRSVESSKDKRPTLAHLRESGAIEQDADTILLMYREGYYKQQAGEADDTNGATEAIIAKQRNGPTGIARLRFYGGNASFGDDDRSYNT